MKLIDAELLKVSVANRVAEILAGKIIRADKIAVAGTLLEMIFCVDSAPPVECVKRGKWLTVCADNKTTLFCSVCGMPDALSRGAYENEKRIVANNSKFCPFCGAKMDK